MADIVEKLRETFHRRRYGPGLEPYEPDYDLLDVAADEIERLRAAGQIAYDILAKHLSHQYAHSESFVELRKAQFELHKSLNRK